MQAIAGSMLGIRCKKAIQHASLGLVNRLTVVSNCVRVLNVNIPLSASSPNSPIPLFLPQALAQPRICRGGCSHDAHEFEQARENKT